MDSQLIIIVSNGLTIISYSDTMNFAEGTLEHSCFSVIRVVQGSGGICTLSLVPAVAPGFYSAVAGPPALIAPLKTDPRAFH